jgi:hypothetical protein
MKIMEFKYLLIVLLFFNFNCFAQQNSQITYLSCTGSEQWTSYWKNPKGDKETIDIDFTLNFNSVSKKITGGTRLLALGCFPTENIDQAKSTCDCKITDEMIDCKSTSYEKNSTGSIREHEFSVNRRTASMTTYRQLLLDGKIKNLVFGNLQCKKVDKQF